MDHDTGRPNHIVDYLVNLHWHSWFDWSDRKNKVYANLILTPRIWDSNYTGTIHEEGMIANPHSLPTEQECLDGLKALQDDWDERNKAYKLNRKKEYPVLREQLDLLYHDITAGKLDATGEWHKAIKKVKDDKPKV